MVFTPTFDGPLFALTLVWALAAVILTAVLLRLLAPPVRTATTFGMAMLGDEPDRDPADAVQEANDALGSDAIPFKFDLSGLGHPATWPDAPA